MVILKRYFLPVFIFSLFWFAGPSLSAQFGDLPKPSIRLELDRPGQLLLVHFDIPRDHHITDIKNGFFAVRLDEHPFITLGEVEYPQGEPYGEETVFRGQVVLRIPLLSKSAWTAPQTLTLHVSWQMCQEAPVEMCFAPDESQMDLTLSEAFAGAAASPGREPLNDGENEGFVDRMMRRFQGQLAGGSFLAFLSVFLLGFLTSLTPCVYPVIPVIMGFVGSRSQGSKAKAFSLSVFFVLGLAFVYSLLGVLAAQTGSVIGASFQNPVFVVIIALVFVAMGLSMAGLFDIPVPSSIAAKAQSGSGKNQWLGAVIVGAVSGFIAAPCAGPVVIALVTFISQTGDLLLGFGLMFSFALGMGMIFLLVGTFSGLVSALPQGGGWMEKIKLFFALLLIGAGIYFITVVTPGWVATLLWGVFIMGFSLLAGMFDPMPEEMPKRFVRLLLLVLLLLGAFLFFDGLREWRHGNAVKGEAVEKSAAHLPWIKDADTAVRLAGEEEKILLVDAYADWCTACKELDHKTFSDPLVSARLQNLVLLKLDLTNKDEASETLRRRFAVLAMPTVIFFSNDHRELARFSGFKGPKDFLAFLDRLPR